MIFNERVTSITNKIQCQTDGKLLSALFPAVFYLLPKRLSRCFIFLDVASGKQRVATMACINLL